MDPALRRRRRAARARRSRCPAACMSPNNPFLDGAAGDAAQQPGLRGDGDLTERQVPVRRRSRAPPSPTPTGVAATDLRVRHPQRRRSPARWPTTAPTSPADFVADMQALDRHRLRASSSGTAAGASRRCSARVYAVDLRRHRRRRRSSSRRRSSTWPRSPTPTCVSLPAIHAGDVGLGDPFRVTCESIEAVHVVSPARSCCSAATTTSRTPAATRTSPTTTSSSSSTGSERPERTVLRTSARTAASSEGQLGVARQPRRASRVSRATVSEAGRSSPNWA